MIITYEEYKKLIESSGIIVFSEEYIQESYKRMCETRLRACFNLILGELYKNGDVEDWYEKVIFTKVAYGIKEQPHGMISIKQS